MTSILMFLLLKDDQADAIMRRCQAALKTLTSFQVQSAVPGSRGEAKGLMVVDGMKRLFFRASAGAEEYTLSVTSDGYREVDDYTRTYDEYPYPGKIHLYNSRISGLFKTIPAWLIGANTGDILPKGAKVVAMGTETVNGVPCDKVQAKFSGQMVNGVIDLSIDKVGYIHRYHTLVNTPHGREEHSWILSNFQILKTIKPSMFANPIGDGYMPFAQPDTTLTLEIGKHASLTGWTDGKTGKPWVPRPGKPLLFVLTGKDSLPSDRAVAAIRSWTATLQAKGVQVAIASNEASKADSQGFLYDGGGKSVTALGAPSTPMFYLFDSGGTLRNLWLGFVPGQGQKLYEDLLKAVAVLK